MQIPVKSSHSEQELWQSEQESWEEFVIYLWLGQTHLSLLSTDKAELWHSRQVVAYPWQR